MMTDSTRLKQKKLELMNVLLRLGHAKEKGFDE